MTVQDLLAGAMDNMSDEQLDEEIRLFKAVAKKLKVKNYDKIIVVVDDGEYNPEWVLSDGEKLKLGGRDVTYYASNNMVMEVVNGELFFYFVSEGDAKKYFSLAKKFLDADELNEKPFGYDYKHAQEWSERHPYGYYNDEGDYSIEEDYEPTTLEEALNKLDKVTGNKYNLLNTYLEENLDVDRKEAIVEMLKEDNSAELIHKYLREDKEDALQFIKNSIKDGVKEGQITIYATDQLDKTLAWLKYNNIPYDAYDADGGTVVAWYVEDEEESEEDMKKTLALEVKDYLQDAMDYITKYINGEYFTETHKNFTIKYIEDALESCKDLFEF